MADHDPHQDKGMEEVLEEVGLGVLTNSFIENRITPTDVLALSEQDFTLLGVTTIGDRVRLREQCRRLLNAEAKTPVLERLKLMQEKRKGKKKVSNNRKPQDCRKINIGWKHRHALTFTLMLANKGGGKFVIDVNKNLPISEFKNLIAEKYFPAGHNTYSNLRLEDLNYFLASFTGNPVEGVKTAGEYITQQQTSPLRIYLHTETKEQETTITEPTDGDNVPLQDYSVPMQVDNVTPQIDNATPRIDNATPRIDNATPRIDNVTPRIDNATPRIDNATPRIDNATSRIDNATHRIDNATSRIDNATPRIDNATSRIDNATSRIDNATSYVDNVHAEAVHFYNAGTPTIQFSSYRRCDLSLDNQENAEAPSSLPLPVDDKDETLDDIGLPAIQFRRRRGRHSLSLQQRRLQTASVPDQPCTSSTIESSGFVTCPIEVCDSEDEQIAAESVLPSAGTPTSDSASMQPTMSDLLKEFQEKTLDSVHTRSTMIVSRRNVLKSAFAAMARPSFNPKAKLYIKFSGEMGEDYGGPRREFFRLAILELQMSSLFSGPDQSRYFSHNLELLEKKHYFLAGQLVALSLAHDGASHICINNHLYDYMVGSDVNIDVCDNVLPHHIQTIISQLLGIGCEQDRERFLFEHGDWLIDQGLTNIYRMSISTKEEYANLLQKQFLCFRTSAEIRQFVDGLGSLGAWEVIKSNPALFKDLFCKVPDPINKEVFEALCEYNRSEEGSNRRATEETTIYGWEVFLQDIEDKVVPVTFEELLSFITGADRVPVLGFLKKIDIMFYNQEPGQCRLPSVSTCGLTIYLPRDEENLSQMLVRALKESSGFHKI